MDEAARLILLLALAGGGLTVLGGLFAWYLDESRRIRRSLKKVLGCEPHALLIARGYGRGVGFDFGRDAVAVTWDLGAWCLTYRTDELMGLELIRDGEVAARVHRGEPRRALEHLAGAEQQVRLRFVFDDVRFPDFDLTLWSTGEAPRPKGLTSAEALQEGARWIARMESLMRRSAPRRTSPAVTAAAVPSPPPAAFAEDDPNEAVA